MSKDSSGGSEIIRPHQVPRLVRRYHTIQQELTSRKELRANFEAPTITSSELSATTETSKESQVGLFPPFDNLEQSDSVDSDQLEVLSTESATLKERGKNDRDATAKSAKSAKTIAAQYQTQTGNASLKETNCLAMHIEPSQCTSRDVLNYISSLKGLASKLKRQVTELDGANKTLKSELAKAENEVSILRESSKEERDAVTKLAAWRNDWKTFENEMNQELALKEAEVNKWKNKVLEKSEKENQLAKSVERLEKDLSSKNEEIKKLKDDSLKKTQMENQMETRIESLEKDLLSKDEVSQKVQKELLEKMQHDKMEHEALKRKEIDILHSELAQENSRADQMAQSIQSLEEKLSLKDAHVIKLKNKLSETTTREDQMAMEMKRLQNELAITKRNNETKNRDLLHRNHLLKKETVDCKRREKEIVSTMKHLEQDVQLTRSEIEAKSDALERVKSQEEAIYGELEMMKNEFACFRKQFADEMAINKPPRHAPGQITSAVSQAFATLVEETERNVNSSGSKSFNGADTVNLCSLYENNYFEALNESRDNRNSRIFSQELSKNLLKLTCGYCEKLIPREEKQIAYLKSLVKDLSQKKFEPSDDDINYLSRQVVKTVAYLFSKSLKTALVVEKKNLKMPLEAI